nr:MAG TPA: NinB protein [Bacteriophage sp.]
MAIDLRASLRDLTYDWKSGRQILSLELQSDFRPYYDQYNEKVLLIKVGEYRKRRSLDANAYCWALIDKLAEKMGLSKAEIYRSAIKEIGGVSNTVCAQDFAVKTLRRDWEKNGLGWQTDVFPSKIKGCTNVVLYRGSSDYDTAQMSRLIDFVVQDCKAVGIETATPEELARLLEGWSGQHSAKT